MIELSRHAQQRCSQRAITDEVVSLVLRNADKESHCGGGCVAIEISRGHLASLRRHHGPLADRARGVILVVNDMGKIVTVLRALSRRAARRYRSGLN